MNNRPLVISTIIKHFTKPVLIGQQNKTRKFTYLKTHRHKTSNSKSLLNEGRPKERKDEENSLAVLTVE